MVPYFPLANRCCRVSLLERCRHRWIVFLIVQSFVMLQLILPVGAAEPSEEGRGAPATAVAFDPSGETIVTGAKDGLLDALGSADG